MTLLALCCSAKINVASPLTINLKPWQTMPRKKKQQQKGETKEEKKRYEQLYFHGKLL